MYFTTIGCIICFIAIGIILVINIPLIIETGNKIKLEFDSISKMNCEQLKHFILSSNSSTEDNNISHAQTLYLVNCK